MMLGSSAVQFRAADSDQPVEGQAGCLGQGECCGEHAAVVSGAGDGGLGGDRGLRREPRKSFLEEVTF